jgi:hypothetical protein
VELMFKLAAKSRARWPTDTLPPTWATPGLVPDQG